MHHLKLLAGASVDGPAGPLAGRAVQRRRLALLAILATGQARGRGVGREKVVAYLWPEADGERGRPLLSDSVYRINQAVGGEAIVAMGDELRLNPELISSDVAEFERAVESGDRERAVTLYAGPLLDGVNLVDGVEFERWLDGERSRLARAYEEVLDALAHAAESTGSMPEAITWWRRLAAHDPFSSRVALRLMQALAAVGDSASAIRHAAVHTTLLRDELGAEPNAAVLKLAERLKAEPVESAIVESPLIVTAPVAERQAKATPPTGTTRASVDLPPSRTSNRAVTAVALALAVVIAMVLVFRERSPASPTAPASSIAVLPFADLSPGKDNAYFSDGITDELINTLTHVAGIQVAARTSAFAYRNGSPDVREVGRRLGVATVLEGSVRKAGDKIRITVQLANAADGYQLWSESYDRQLTDVFAIQEDISREIVSVLRGRLIPPPAVRIAEQSTQDADAEYFQQAAARAPQYARAYVGLGDAYAVLGFYDYLAPRKSFPRAEEAARRALAIDSTLAAAHATLGYVQLYSHWNWPAAEATFRRSIALDPS